MRASDADFSRALEHVIGEYRADRYSGPGNPLQAQIFRRGALLATKVPFAPKNPMFNQVSGLEDPADLIADFDAGFGRLRAAMRASAG